MRGVVVMALASMISTGEATRVDCAALCQRVTACREDPHGHGSYCKDDQTPNVCFGMPPCSLLICIS
jgi:hypothetical protein